MTWTEIRTDLVILACAVSAGIHAALTPEHFREATPAGAGFAASVVLLAALAVWLTRRPESTVALGLAVLVFAGLLVAYGLAVTTGVPVLMPEPEPVDSLALFTKAVETTGLLVAAGALRPAHIAASLRLEGRLT